MTRRTILLSAAMFVLLVALLMWLITPTKTATVTDCDERWSIFGAGVTASPTQAATSQPTTSPIPSVEGGAAVAAAIDKLAPEQLHKGMVAFLANYPKEATEYALRKIRENPDTREFSTATYISSVSYALAKTDRPALERWFAEVPANIRPLAEYSATARYVDDGDLQSAVASLTPASESFTVMRVADLYAERDPQAAAEWAQQYQGTHNYEIAIMSVIRALAKTDATLARQWLKAMPAGSNQKLLLAELNSAPAAPTGLKVDQ